MVHRALDGNPIRNYAPSVDEFAFLSKLNLLSMDPDQFATRCSASETRDLHGYAVCLGAGSSGIGAATGANSQSTGSKTVSVVLNVLLVVVLVLVLVAAYHKRKLRRRAFRDLVAKELAVLHSKESGIWDDDVLLRHRLDAAAVVRQRVVAAGMFGEVWLALYATETVALKCLRETDPSRASLASFVDEIKLLSTLAHPKVVRFIGVVWTKATDIAVLTEFMPRGDLRQHLDRTKADALSTNGDAGASWDDAFSLHVALDVTEALVYLHSLAPAVIHRDLKSRNVLLNATHAKLSDFGTSRHKLEADDDDDDNGDRAAVMTAGVGTVRWVAPEVLAGDRYDESADLFSLGVILSELDTHALPYADARGEDGTVLSESAIAHFVVAGSLGAPSFSVACPDEIRALATRCTSRDPAARPTALQVAFELRTLLRRPSSNRDSTLSRQSATVQHDERGEGSESAREDGGDHSPVTLL